MTVVGIDLGTTFSAVATLDEAGSPICIANVDGEFTTPSVIHFEEPGKLLVGTRAARAKSSHPRRTVDLIKRHIGDKHFRFECDGRVYRPVELSALILRKLKEDAEQKIGPISDAVITVPAYFDERRRQETSLAGELAGLSILEIVNEPTAAALDHVYRRLIKEHHTLDAASYALHTRSSKENVVVYDLGGGTFDVSVLVRERADIRVLATAGDVELGGFDWTQRIADTLHDKVSESLDVHSRSDLKLTSQIFDTAETIKRDLTSCSKTTFCFDTQYGECKGDFSRDNLETLTADLLFRTESRLNRVLRDANLKWGDISTVMITGGASRMPMVKELVTRLSGIDAIESRSPDHAVAEGAAIYANMLGIRRSDNQGGAYNTHANVSLWSRLGAKVSKTIGSMHATSVNAHSLGIVTTKSDSKRHVHRMIPRNTGLPTEVSHCFGTVRPNQQRVNIEVVEGESRKAEECYPIGSCAITNLPPGLPRASPIEVRFQYDSGGRLNITAKHIPSGIWATTSIDRDSGIDAERSGLSKDLIEHLIVR